MKKKEEIIQARREYIKERINNSHRADVEIRKISKELFISERTVLRDLKK
jgi:DeoR/GlpR family transcriptional regulator of sugar metabolism